MLLLVVLNPNDAPIQEYFLWIPAAADDNDNPNGIKTLLAKGWSTAFINGKPVFSNGLISLPRNQPESIISLLFSNNSCRKLAVWTCVADLSLKLLIIFVGWSYIS